MGRKAEAGIPYYPCLSDHTEHEKIRSLVDEFDSHGYWIYKCLLDRVYKRKGYYMEFNDKKLMEQFAKDVCHKPVSLVDEVIAGCLRRSLFDKGVAEKFGVLTSDRIQENYLWATRDRRSKGYFITLIRFYLLIDLSDEKKIIILPKNELGSGNSPEELIPPPKNEFLHAKEESKEENNIEKKTTVKNSPPHDFFNSILEDKTFTEPVLMMHKIDEKKLTVLLRKFFTSKRALQKDKWNDYFDCRSNFFNWIPIELSRGAGNGKYTPPATDPVYVSQVTKEEPLPDLRTITAEQREQARIELQQIIDADFKNYCENDSCLIRFAPMKMDFLRKYKIFEPTEEQRKVFNDLAVGERMVQLNLNYDPVTRITLRHYQEGRLPEGDTANLQAIAKELALRHYFEMEKQKLYPEPEETFEPNIEEK